jgi:hypothetical protein
VIWSKPDDLTVDLKEPLAGLGKAWPNGFLAVFVDGHSIFIRDSIDPEMLRRLFQASDGQVIDYDVF